MTPGADPMLVSHGDDSGPKRLRFSAEDGYQRRHGHGSPVFLSAFYGLSLGLVLAQEALEQAAVALLVAEDARSPCPG